MNPKNSIIVVGRQYGSGGRAVGKLLADRLGIPYYDKELLTEASKKFGIDSEILQFTDEKKPGIFRTIFSSFLGNSTYDYTQPSMSHEKLYEVQSSAIINIAKQSPCVIVGRTSDYVLREDPRLISVFIHADIKTRALRIIHRNEIDSLEKAEMVCRRKDKQRSEFYRYFTGRVWGAADNYDLTLDSTNLEIDSIVDLIIDYISRKKTV